MALDVDMERQCMSGSGDKRSGSPPAPAPLKFSIEKILSPDFGRRESAARAEKAAAASADKDAFPPAKNMWPAWCYCTRYSDRPSSGPRRIRSKQSRKSTGQEYDEDDQSPRSRRIKQKTKKPDEKRPRTAFSAEQLARLKQEFQENRYLTEKRRQDLAKDLKLNESQIKIWFQNKRAKIKKASGQRNPLALQLMAQGLYNHSTVPVREDEDDERPESRSSSS